MNGPNSCLGGREPDSLQIVQLIPTATRGAYSGKEVVALVDCTIWRGDSEVKVVNQPARILVRSGGSFAVVPSEGCIESYTFEHLKRVNETVSREKVTVIVKVDGKVLTVLLRKEAVREVQLAPAL